MINFTEEEKSEIKKVIYDYHQMNMIYKNYLTELERIKKFIEKVEVDFKIINEREKRLMDSLHDKYGDFSLQEIYNLLNDGTESGFGECEVKIGENT